MSHAAEGTLQAYLDGEIDSTAAAALREHLALCDACAGELDVLRRISDRVHTAVALLDVAAAPAPLLRARAALASGRAPGEPLVLRRFGSGSLARAAMLLLVLAGAGAAAIPPARRAIQASLARVVELFSGRDASDVAAPPAPLGEPLPAPATVPNATFVQPVDGAVRILLHAARQPVEVVVRFVDSERAEILIPNGSQPPRLRSGSGRVEVIGLTGGMVEIGIPRSVRHATVEVDGVVFVHKENGRLSGPDGSARGSGEVRFRIGS